MELSNEEISRYSRHLILPEVGMEGQKKLKAAKVLLVGSGGLGSPLAIYLAAAGVGTLGLVDFDVVDFSNLHRQVVHFTDDVGKPKIQSAKEKISKLNPEVNLITHETMLDSNNAKEIIKNYDIVVDGTDNFPTRYLVNDACILLGKINVYGSIFRFDGQVTVFGYEDGPCYRCLFSEPPEPGLVPSCAEGGVIGVLPGVIGMLQATEAVKIICEIGQPLKGRLLYFDALKMKFRELKIRKDPNCPLCGPNPTITELIDYQQFCGIPKADDKEKPMNQDIPHITVQELDKRMKNENDDLVVIDVREPHEFEIARIEGATLKPLSEFENNFSDLPKDKEIAIHCKMGGRSLQACEFLKGQGYDKIMNVTGGITAWAQEVDSSVATY